MGVDLFKRRYRILSKTRDNGTKAYNVQESVFPYMLWVESNHARYFGSIEDAKQFISLHLKPKNPVWSVECVITEKDYHDMSRQSSI